MIKELWYVRHGQSTANAAGVYGGSRNDLELTVMGREQAATAGELLKSVGINCMIASPLKRAQDTACIIADCLGYPGEAIATDERLCEVDSGKLTGTPDLGFPAYLEYVQSGTDPVAETPECVAERLQPFLTYLAHEPSLDGKVVLLVAHAGVGRIMRWLTTGVPMANLATLDVPNAQPFQLPINRLEVGEKA